MFALIRLSLTALFVLSAGGIAARAAGCPEGTVLAVVTPQGPHCYDKAALAALPERRIATENDFVDGKVTFSGPGLLAVLKDAGAANASDVEVAAADGYAIAIPMEEIERYRPVLAMRADGEPIDHDMYGKLWLIYPMSDFPELQGEKWNGRLIWQVVKITAE